MKTLDEYLKLPYRLVLTPDPDEGGFIASYPELPGCITCGKTIEAAAEAAVDAKRTWIEAALSDGIQIQDPLTADDYSGQFKLRIPKSLHKSLSDHSKEEGISMNQYCLYLLTKNDAEHRISR